MSYSENTIFLVGNLVEDPELKYTAGDSAVVNTTLATNRSYKVDDEWESEAEYHDLVFWESKAENLAKIARKGTKIVVRGRLMYNKWEDKNGMTHKNAEIRVSNFIIPNLREIKSKKEDGSLTKEEEEEEFIKEVDDTEEVVDPDDIPF